MGFHLYLLPCHDPDHTDVVIDQVVKEARNCYPKVRGAAEGMEINS